MGLPFHPRGSPEDGSVVSDPVAEGLRPELLDDFYAESDELLGLARASISQVEAAIKDGAEPAAGLESLFRSMHSLKGICAIAGVRPAENLAHGLEDLLRALTRDEVAVSAIVVDQLLAGIEQLARTLAAFRAKQPLPDPSTTLAAVRELLPTRMVAAAAPAAENAPVAAESDAVGQARRRGLGIWRVVFSPSPSLDQRGVRVNVIRERLEAAGEILSAAPAVQPGGLRFVFVFAAPRAPDRLPDWERDGVTFERVGPSPSLPATSAPAATVGEPVDAASLSLTPSRFVRVDLGQLDDLMRITGEIIIQRSRLQDRLAAGGVAADDLREIDVALGRSLRELRAGVSRVRLVPVSEVFSRMPYAVRDLLRGSDRDARVVIEGGHTEMDKFLVERLKEPLLHLVRNALAHAIEPAAERKAAGKPTEATLRLRAARAGGSVVIEVTDDGRGIDPVGVAARARRLGLPVRENPDARGLLDLLCHPGFSTRDTADRGAGRGVGMAVVRSTVQELGGSLQLASERGRGTTFTLRLPLTLSIADVLVLRVGEQRCALAQAHIEEIFQAPAATARTIQETEVVPHRGGLMPFVRLRKLFGADEAGGDGNLTIVVVRSERGATGLVVDRVESRREIVLRPMADPLVQVPGIAGATELGDGRPLLVLDPAAITAGVVRPPEPAVEPAESLTT